MSPVVLSGLDLFGCRSAKDGRCWSVVICSAGSINTTSRGKGNFYDYVLSIFGGAPPVDVGLPVPGPNSYSMPGTNNVPQAMGFETNMNWFVAYGIPICFLKERFRFSILLLQLIQLNQLTIILRACQVISMGILKNSIYARNPLR